MLSFENKLSNQFLLHLKKNPQIDSKGISYLLFVSDYYFVKLKKKWLRECEVFYFKKENSLLKKVYLKNQKILEKSDLKGFFFFTKEKKKEKSSKEDTIFSIRTNNFLSEKQLIRQLNFNKIQSNSFGHLRIVKKTHKKFFFHENLLGFIHSMKREHNSFRFKNFIGGKSLIKTKLKLF